MSSEVCKDGLLTGVKLLLMPDPSKLSDLGGAILKSSLQASVILTTSFNGTHWTDYLCFLRVKRESRWCGGDPEAAGVAAAYARHWASADQAHYNCCHAADDDHDHAGDGEGGVGGSYLS